MSRLPSWRRARPWDGSGPAPPGERARLSLLLPVLALLLGTLGLFAAAPAAAQTTVWSATLTVDGVGGDFGCSNSNAAQDNCSSALTQDEFTWRGVTYTVALVQRTGNGLVFNLEFDGLSGSAAKTALGALTLNLGGLEFAIGDALTSARSGLQNRLRWVRAISGSNSRWTDAQQVRVSLTAPPSPPARPTGFRARAGAARVALSWSASRDSSITKYQYRQQAGANAWDGWTDIPDSAPGGRNATSYTVAGLEKGVAYQFRIRAVNAAGNGAQSNVAGPVTPRGPVTPIAPPVTAAVWSATLTVDQSGTFSTYFGCGPFTGMDRCSSSTTLTDDDFAYGGTTYSVTRLYWRSDLNRLYLWLDSRWSTPLTSAQGSLTLIVDGHRFALGESLSTSSLVSWPFNPNPDWADGRQVRVSLSDSTVPLPLTGLRAMAGDGQVTLTWDNPNAATFRNERPQVTYRWEYQQREGDGAWGAWQEIPGFRCRSNGTCGTFLGPEEIAVVTGLRNGTTYSFRVRSKPHRIDSRTRRDTYFHTASAAVSATPRAGVAPVRVTPGPGRDELTVEWTQPDAGRWRGQERFEVQWKSGTQDWDHSRNIGLGYGNARWVLRDLQPGIEYTVRVWTSLGPRMLGEVTATPGAAAPPPPAPALEFAWASGSQMMLRFDKVLDESSVPPAGAFAVSVAGAARGVSSVAVSQDTVTLTLSSPVSAGDSGLTVGYTPPSSGKLRTAGGGAAVAAFSDRSVGNDTPSSGERQVRPPPEPIEPPAVEPLTARVAAAPSEHRGKGQFKVRVAFSAPVAGRAKDAGVEVSGGILTRAVRVNKRKDLWELRVQPTGYGAVTVTLPATVDCAAAGAVCTADGRRLESAVTHTVQGPPALSVADASAQEAGGSPRRTAGTSSSISTRRGATAPATCPSTASGSALPRAGRAWRAGAGGDTRIARPPTTTRRPSTGSACG